MKKLLVVMFSLLLVGFVAASQAADNQMPAKSGQDMPMMECPMMNGGQMPMGQMHHGGMMMDGKMHPMMKQHGMMMQDMMQMMKDTMVIQKKMLASPKPEDSIKMQAQLDYMISKIDKMMMYHQNCMMQMQKPSGDSNKGQMPSGDQQAPDQHQHQ